MKTKPIKQFTPAEFISEKLREERAEKKLSKEDVRVLKLLFVG